MTIVSAYGEVAVAACLALVVVHSTLKAHVELKREIRHAARRLRRTTSRWRRVLIVVVTICGACTTVGPAAFYGHEFVEHTHRLTSVSA